MVRRLRHAWRLLNLPCEGISELVSRSLDERLSPAERAAYRSHLVYCVACRRYRRQLLMLREALGRAGGRDGRPGSGPGMPEELKERIRRQLKDR